MKLKKVTALLLATSMLLTSVNVAPIFADEEITFAEENYTVEDDASADADFGDVVVEDTAAEDETASADADLGDVVVEDTAAEEETYADEVVEDSYVEEEAVAEDEALEEGAIPEEFEDVYAALENASDEAAYASALEEDNTRIVFKDIENVENLDTYRVFEGGTLEIANYIKEVQYSADGGETWAALTEGTQYVISGDHETSTVGAHTFKVSGVGNYTGDVEFDWEIVEVPTTSIERDYDENAVSDLLYDTFGGSKDKQELKIRSATFDGTSVAVSGYVPVENFDSYAEFKNAGTLELGLTFGGNGTNSEKIVTIVTNKAEATLTASSDTFVYGEQIVGGYTIEPAAADSEIGTVTYAYKDDSSSYNLATNPNLHVGTYTVTPVVGATATNYNVTPVDGKLTITAKAVKANWKIDGTLDSPVTYDASDHTPAIESVVDDANAPISGFEFTYAGDTTGKTSKDYTATATVKTYPTMTPASLATDYDFGTSLSFAWKITAEKATVAIAEAEVTYGTDPSKIKIYRQAGGKYYENTYTGTSADKEVAIADLDENHVIYTLDPDNATKGTVSLDVQAYKVTTTVAQSPLANALHLNTDKLTMTDYTLPQVTPVTLTINQYEITNDDIVWGTPDIFTYDNGKVYTYAGATRVKALNGDSVAVSEYYQLYNGEYVTTLSESERGDYLVRVTGLSGKGAGNYVISDSATHTWHILDGLSKTVTYNGDWQTIDVPSTYYAIEFWDDALGQWKEEPPKFIDVKYESTEPGKITPVTFHTWDSYEIKYRTMATKNSEWATTDANGKPLTAYLTIVPKTITASLNISSVAYGYDFDRLIPLGKDYDAFVGSDKASEVYKTYDFATAKYTDSRFTFEKWDGYSWVDYTKTDDYTTFGWVVPAGKYRIKFNTSSKEILTHVNTTNYVTNYIIDLQDTEFTVSQTALHVDWPRDLTYNGYQQQYDEAVPVKIIDNAGAAMTYTVVIEGNYGKNVGSYTASIVKILDASYRDVTDSVKIADSEKTHVWKINPLKVKVVVQLNNDKVRYGDDDPTSSWNMTDINVYKYDETKANVEAKVNKQNKAEISGTPVFRTSYKKWSDANLLLNADGTYTKAGSAYKVTVSGLTSTNYEIVNYVDGGLYVAPAEVIVKPADVVVGVDATPVVVTEYGYAGYKASYPSDVVAAQHDDEAKLFTIKLNTVPAIPQGVGTYPIQSAVTYGSSYIRSNGTQNVIVHTTADADDATAKKATGTYSIIRGEVTVTFDNWKGDFDNKYHSIIVTPATLPTGISVFYSTTDLLKKYGADGTNPTKAQLDAAKAAFMGTEGTTVNPLFLKAGVYNVYYYVTGEPTYELEFFGSKTVTILDTDQASAEEIENKIKEALVKDADGNYDQNKIADARKAYDGATQKVKDLVDPILVKELEEAEKAAAKQLADQIKALLPADPSKAVDTDRPNYEQAQGIYDGATDAEKAALADEKALLDAAKAAIEADEAAKEKVFTDAVSALPTAAEAQASDRAAVDAAKAIYDGLTAKEKEDVAAVKAVLDGIDAAVAAAEKAEEEADKKAADAVTAMINALPAPEDVTVADENAIENAVKALDALTDAQEALVPDVAKDKLAADVLALVAAKVKEAEEQAAADEIEALIDAIAKSEPGDGKAAMEAAKDAFNNATADVQAKVDKGHQEVLASAVKYYTKDTTFEAGKGVYRVLSNGDVTYVKPLYPEDTYFQVPNDVVCRDGFPFKVVKVSVNAFKGCTNVTKIWMGKNIVTIGKYAFKGATNLRTLIVRTQAIDVTEKIENAFAGMAANRNGKVNVQIWEKMLSKYEPMFRGAGKLPAKAYFTTID